MPPNSLEPGLPLLIVVEGENDIRFLKAISTMLHAENPDLLDLARLAAEGQAVFLPTGGSNLTEWVARIASLHKRTFYLFDREQDPEMSRRRMIVEAANQRAGCRAILTRKRAVENYLHPVAIREACGIDLSFDDDTDVAGLLALKMMERSGESSWHRLPYKRQKRIHDKAKRTLNAKAVQLMTPVLLAEQDPEGEIIGWLQIIRQMVEISRPARFAERDLATVLAALRHWQQDLAENDGPISEHFADASPLTVEEIDDLCERLNCAPPTA